MKADLTGLSLADLATIKDHSLTVVRNCQAWLKHVAENTDAQKTVSEKDIAETKAAAAQAELMYSEANTEFNARIKAIFNK